MRSILIFSVLMAFMAGCTERKPGQDEPQGKDTIAEGSGYDSAYASSLGADEFGMKKYVMAFLKRGPNRTQDSATAASLQKAHLENIDRLAKEGKLIVAGPFLDNTELRGIYIFDVSTTEEARQLTETDPAIRAGRLEMELHPWYGPAGLMEITNIEKRIVKKKIF